MEEDELPEEEVLQGDEDLLLEDQPEEEGLLVEGDDEGLLTPPVQHNSPEYNSYTSSILAIASTPLVGTNEEVLENFLNTSQQTLELLEQGQESVIRQQISDLQVQQKIKNYTELFNDEASNVNADLDLLQSAGELLAITEQERSKNAAEELAIQNIEDYALTNPQHQAVVLQMMKEEELGNLKTVTAMDYISDQMYRKQVIIREASKLASKAEDRNWFTKTFDFLANVIPFNDLTTVDALPGQVEGLLGSGTSMLQTKNTLMTTSREEFDKMVPIVFESLEANSGWFLDNFGQASIMANKLVNINTTEADNQNQLDYVDIGLTAFDLATVGLHRVVGNLSKAALLKLGAAKELAKDVTVNTIESANSKTVPQLEKGNFKETDLNTAFDEAQPSATKVTEESSKGLEVGISPAVSQELELQEQIQKTLASELNDVGRLSKEDYDIMVLETKSAIESKYDNVVDFKAYNTETVTARTGEINTGIPFANVLLGTKGGTKGYVYKSTAEANLKKMGLKDVEVIQGVDGQFYGKLYMPLNEKKYMKLNENDTTGSGIISRWLRSPAAFMSEHLQQRAVQSGFKTSRINKIMQPLMKPIQDLSKDQKEALQSVWERGNVNNVWYTDLEFVHNFTDLNKRPPTQSELLGYKTLKNINDADYMLINHDLYIKNSVDGWKTGSIDVADIDLTQVPMKKTEVVTNLNNSIFLDTRKGGVIEGRDITIEALEKRIKDEGDELFRLKHPIDTEEGVVNYVISKSGDVKIEPLKYNQVEYRAGGHRLYDGNYFVKMAQTGVTKSGKKYIKNPKTFTVAKSKGEAEAYANRWNQMLEGYWKTEKSLQREMDKLENKLSGLKKPTSGKETLSLRKQLLSIRSQLRDKKGILDPVDLLKLIEGHGYTKGLDEFEKTIKANKFDSDTKFKMEAVFDKEEPRAHLLAKQEDGVYDMTSTIGPHESWMESSGRLYYSRRGKPLDGVQEERASFIDPFKTAQMAVTNSISKAGFTNYRVTAVNSWLNTYGSYLPKDGKSADWHFWNSSKLLPGQELVRQKAETLRQTIKRQIGYKTDTQGAQEIAVRKFSEFIEGTVGSKASNAAFNFLSKDPVSALKSFAFDLKLGLFDPSQLIVQTQTAAALAIIDPANAVKFMQDGAFMRMALVNQSDEFTSYISKFTSMEKDEWKAFMTEARTSGTMDVGTELVLLERSGASPIGKVGGVATKIRDAGRFPFYEAERWNRMIAFRKAWTEARGKFDLKDMGSPDAKALLANQVDKYTMNMTRSSGAAWQQGILSAPTQFLSYQARFLENMAPVILGGNKQWKAGQKAALLASQVILYGAAGVGLDQYLNDKFFSDPNNAGAEFAEANPTLYRAMVGGFFDSMIYGISGGEADVAFSDRVSVIKGWVNYYDKLNGGDFQSTSFLEILGGAPLGVLFEFGSDTLDVFNLATIAAHSERVALSDVTPDIIEELINNVSSLSRASRMYYGIKYGTYYSSKSGKALDRVTKPEAFLLALGITPRDITNMGYAFDMVKSETELVKELALPIGKIRLKAFRAAADGNHEEADRLFKLSAAMLTPFDNSIRVKIAKAATKGSGQTVEELARTRLFNKLGKTLPQ